jgi:phage host-nuclease inhibitor protein Gam
MSEALKEQQETRERFTVDNDMKAEWCLSKIRNVRKEKEKEIAELQRQMQFYKDQIDLITKQAEEDENFFKSMLMPYFAERQEAGFAKETKTQISYKTPSGILKIKHQNPEFNYKDHQDETIAWLKQNEMAKFVKVKEEVDWAELKKTVTISGNGVATQDGEMIPGITVTPKDDIFEVEVK